MRELIKRIVLRTFPELTAGLHLDRYARVLKVADAPEDGGTCERFRPRYAVDVEILTPEGEPDKAFPRYEAVPLPVNGAGNESGQFAYPEPGAMVVIGFAYGRADHPIIRQVYPLGLSLPELTNGELRWQQSATVYQSADKHGNWTRSSEATITDESLRQVRRCVESIDNISREWRTVLENSTEEVGGVKTIEALGSVLIGSGGRMNISAVDSMNLTTARDMRLVVADNMRVATGADYQEVIKGSSSSNITGNEASTVGGNFTQSVSKDYTQTIKGKSSSTVTKEIAIKAGGTITHTAGGVFTIAAPKIVIGSGAGGVHLIEETLGVWEEVRDALKVLAGHTHSHPQGDTGAPLQGGIIAAHSTAVGEHHDRVESISG
ncbi:bacteriophage T4 gp5 trimerization domain-containing protein (plasmid) [Halodesulfovibrio aestuarii]|uniref:Gp5/Type VI secretion system Vgr C-terminal trimerisation domain-containing protein n=1 Tax=Halodesulfovibrio aestuarii TaxID=126333 RepID=A0A8G2CC60_9BACT|nr:hypothetical protein [Halodesulfovibrio aestuarii]SHJ72514.1 hypothetical protein SAMN05660830_03091 [Halodesulfovibrio aestuarii]